MAESDDKKAPRANPGRYTGLFVAASALLAVLAGGLFYLASQHAGKAVLPEAGMHKVTVGARACEPNTFVVPAGRTTFEIFNASERTLEWEILDGVMVIDERENIAPGLRQKLTVKLVPGEYQITCGLLSNPRGTLKVTASAEWEQEKARPPIVALLGPVAEYKVFLVMQANALARQVEALSAALGSGDREAAKIAFAAARADYKRLEGVMGNFADLENRIDPRASHFDAREKDAAFIGFHRIEYGLFGDEDLAWLASFGNMLAVDAGALKVRIRALDLEPADLVRNGERQARRLSGESDGESPYAHQDGAEFAAALDGIEKPIALLAPLLEGARPELAKSLSNEMGRARQALAAFSSPKPFKDVDPEQREALAKSLGTLADGIAGIDAALGLE